jgi:uridine nucleosidase
MDPIRPPARRKVIIDTDPGIDDMMAIFMAFQAPEVEVIGLTTIFGNVNTDLATINALYLCELAGFPDIPVAEGPSESLQCVKPRIAYFVHGSDGLGETHKAKPKGQKAPISAPDFLVKKAAEFPGEVTVVALGPLTNIALAVQKDPDFAKNLGQLVVLGGAFNACGNVNPAAEANIFCDPEAADITFTAGMKTLAIGINLTTQVVFSEEDLLEIRDSGGKFGQYVYECCRFYHQWHIESDHFDGIFLHDPTCMAALLDPSLFTFRKGAVRVETVGRCVGHTILDYGLKNWKGNNPWVGVPPVDVGITVDVDGVRNLVKKYLCS